MFNRSAKLCGVLAALLSRHACLRGADRKSQGIALNEFAPVISPYDLTLNELSRVYRQVYRTLLSYDERSGGFVPELATSWKRINDTTLEFELRVDVTFHSGNKFSADDVVYTVQYLISPESKIPGKARYFWMKGAEKVGPTTVRIVANNTIGIGLDAIANELYILDSRVHGALADKASYGRVSASSAGHYKLVSLDPRRGALFERFDGFKGDLKFHRAPIKFIQLVPLPERQTQIAQLLTGGVDVLRNVEPDIATNLVRNPDFESSTFPSGYFVYMLLDAAGRSGVAPLKDVRVRRAIAMGIDRETIGMPVELAGGAAESRWRRSALRPTSPARGAASRRPMIPPAAREAAGRRGLSERLCLAAAGAFALSADRRGDRAAVEDRRAHHGRADADHRVHAKRGDGQTVCSSLAPDRDVSGDHANPREPVRRPVRLRARPRDREGHRGRRAHVRSQGARQDPAGGHRPQQ